MRRGVVRPLEQGSAPVNPAYHSRGGRPSHRGRASSRPAGAPPRGGGARWSARKRWVGRCPSPPSHSLVPSLSPPTHLQRRGCVRGVKEAGRDCHRHENTGPQLEVRPAAGRPHRVAEHAAHRHEAALSAAVPQAVEHVLGGVERHVVAAIEGGAEALRPGRVGQAAAAARQLDARVRPGL